MATGERVDQIRGRDRRQVVTSADILDGTIVSADIADGTIVAGDLNAALYGTGTTTIDPDDATAHGASTAFSRTDHQHQATTAAAVQLNDTNAEGSASTFARSDHNHALPDLVAKGHRFEQSATTNSAGATAETVVLTITNVVFKDGRAYRAIYGSACASASAAGEVAFTIRKTNAAGTIYGGPVRHLCGATANATYFAEGERLLKRATGAGDLTTDVVLTITGVIGGNAAHVGTSTNPRYLLIEDIGDADDYALAVAVA